MKSLNQFIQEKLIIKEDKNNYKYFPKTKEELRKIIEQRIKEEGNEVDLNDIYISKIIDMSYLFVGTNFNGDISRWDVSNVTDIHSMFSGCENFNGDISGWNVSNVTNMCGIFSGCKNFNGNIANWDVSKVTDMRGMFNHCEKFNQDISKWNVSKVTNMY